MRIVNHPILGACPERKMIHFTFNGTRYTAREGEPIAAALLAHGVRKLRLAENSGEPRGLYCGIGHCYECRVMVNGKRSIRACITPVAEGMVISSQGGPVDES